MPKCTAAAKSWSGSSGERRSATGLWSGSSRRSTPGSAGLRQAKRLWSTARPALKTREAEAERVLREQQQRLERIAGLTAEEARREVHAGGGGRGAERGGGAGAGHQGPGQARAPNGRPSASSRWRSSASPPSTPPRRTVSAVALPSDEMKGRIIGREGRNIRAFETATGVDVIIDDTPDTVIISCFDPIRREVGAPVARGADQRRPDPPGPDRGSGHQGRRRSSRPQLAGAGRAGRLRHRHPRPPPRADQADRPDALSHVATGRTSSSTRRKWPGWPGSWRPSCISTSTWPSGAALLHDVGKVLTHENEGTHVELGVEVARKYGETAAVINCIHAHHDDVPHESTESVLVQAADAISGVPSRRPPRGVRELRQAAHPAGGDRQRLHRGGEDQRHPGRTGDSRGRDPRADRRRRGGASSRSTIARRIENELQYPGQIKVVVIRETRAVDFAR